MLNLLKHLLRLCSLRRFGYLIASLSQSQANSGGVKFFEYDNRRALFVAHEQQTSNVNEKNTLDQGQNQPNRPITSSSIIANTPDAASKKTASPASAQSLRDDRKLQLMKSMAQLRLEVD